MALQITFTEAVQLFAEKAKAFLLSPIPDKERIGAVLSRLQTDLQGAQTRLIEAKGAVVRIKNKLPNLQERLNTLEGKGREWTQEMNAPGVTEPRRKQLELQIQSCALECERLETEIGGLNKTLMMREQTARIYDASYSQKRTEYEKLKKIAPVLIAQTEALKLANAEKMQALRTAVTSNGTDITGILTELQDSLDTEQASYEAVTEMAESEPSMDLEAVLAAETLDGATSARIHRWGQPQS